MSEAWLFFREFAQKPGQLGAVAPSSARLAAEMVRAAGIRPGDVLVELGAGTGPFTKAVLDAFPENPFLALEPSAPLAVTLRERFPGLRVEERYAAELPGLCAEWGHPRVDRILSGLPWAVFPDDLQDSTLQAVVDVLAPDGRMVTFQYVHSQVLPQARAFRARLDRYFGKIERTETTWWNVPPAFVYVLSEPKKSAT